VAAFGAIAFGGLKTIIVSYRHGVDAVTLIICVCAADFAAVERGGLTSVMPEPRQDWLGVLAGWYFTSCTTSRFSGFAGLAFISASLERQSST
jgi:hypothetical protein